MIARHTTVQRVAQHMRQHSTCITAGPASNGHKVCVQWTTACMLMTMEGCTCRLATACRFTCDYCWCGHQQRTQSSCIPPLQPSDNSTTIPPSSACLAQQASLPPTCPCCCCCCCPCTLPLLHGPSMHHHCCCPGLLQQAHHPGRIQLLF